MLGFEEGQPTGEGRGPRSGHKYPPQGLPAWRPLVFGDGCLLGFLLGLKNKKIFFF